MEASTLMGRGWLLLANCQRDIHISFTLERRIPSEHVIGHAAEREHIGAAVHFSRMGDLLGRHPLQRAQQTRLGHDGLMVKVLAYPGVDDVDPIARADHDVGGLEVPINETRFMNSAQTRSHLGDKRQSPAYRKFPLGFHESFQGDAINEREPDEVIVSIPPVGNRVHHVGMTDVHSPFTLKVLDMLGVVPIGWIGDQLLDGRQVARLPILGFSHVPPDLRLPNSEMTWKRPSTSCRGFMDTGTIEISWNPMGRHGQ